MLIFVPGAASQHGSRRTDRRASHFRGESSSVRRCRATQPSIFDQVSVNERRGRKTMATNIVPDATRAQYFPRARARRRGSIAIRRGLAVARGARALRARYRSGCMPPPNPDRVMSTGMCGILRAGLTTSGLARHIGALWRSRPPDREGRSTTHALIRGDVSCIRGDENNARSNTSPRACQPRARSARDYRLDNLTSRHALRAGEPSSGGQSSVKSNS
jgi:hypothetical protein